MNILFACILRFRSFSIYRKDLTSLCLAIAFSTTVIMSLLPPSLSPPRSHPLALALSRPASTEPQDVA